MTRLDQQLAFIDELDKAKAVFRRSHLVGEDRKEDDAQHQWHFAVMALILAEHAAEPIDVGRVVAVAPRPDSGLGAGRDAGTRATRTAEDAVTERAKSAGRPKGTVRAMAKNCESAAVSVRATWGWKATAR